jgi:nanoRNase/pAp phosphatase (c-di-AMP/oligoRNAs hydrolase)
MSSEEKYRLVTRSDFDGLACAVLLKYLNIVNEIQFVHPKDMQDGLIAVSKRDITTNLPYVNGVHLAFDHHLSETIRVEKRDNHIIDPHAPSAARVVYDYYGGKKVFDSRLDDMMKAVDQGDSAQYSHEDILNPQGWALMNFLMDARTGLGRFREFRISNYQLMMNLIDYCASHTVEEILALPDVKERVDLYREQHEQFVSQIKRCTKVYDRLVVLDLRNEEVIHAGNRFVIYALFPETNISIHVMWGVKKQNTVFAIGKSILNRTSPVNVGALCLEYNGGGHENAGTCQVSNDQAEPVLDKIIKQIVAEG